MTWLFDNNFAPRLVDMLRALGVDAVALRERFPESIKDHEFLPQLRDSGMILVTADLRIQRRPIEAEALRQSGVSAVFLRQFWHKQDLWGQAAWLVRHWRDIESYVTSLTPPVYIDVEHNGRRTRITL